MRLVNTGSLMVQSKRFVWIFCLSLGACVPVMAQDAPTLGVSPATSLGLGGQADVQLSSAADSAKRPAWARFASGTGTVAFLAAGTLLPLATNGRDGKQGALRVADSLLTSTLLTEGLKRLVRAKRPDTDERDSFPSSHATAAFAVATMQAHYHPRQAVFWYAGAAVIAYSRIKLRRHRTKDVVAGALVGVATSRLEIQQSRGLLLFPFIRPRREGGGNGISLSMNF